MSVVGAVVLVAGVAVILLAGIGLLRLQTPYARIHAAGKASPVAFMIVAIGGAVELGWASAARLVLACAALVITLPVAVHLLFRAVRRSSPEFDPPIDEMPAR